MNVMYLVDFFTIMFTLYETQESLSVEDYRVVSFILLHGVFILDVFGQQFFVYPSQVKSTTKVH